MDEIGRQLDSLRALSPRDVITAVIDVLLVAYLIYRVLLLVRGTRAWRIMLGIVLFLLALWLSGALKLHTLNWVLEKATILGPVALVILFLPELRQAMEGVGKLGAQPLRGLASPLTDPEGFDERVIDEVVEAMYMLGRENVGALLVFEIATPLDEVGFTGVPLGNARVSAAFLRSIFYGQNPLHDGAALVRGHDVVAAACRLPLSENQALDQNLHMRHRAAVGVTEMYDCLALVVSEERGTVSWVREGRIRRVETPAEMRQILNKELRGVDLTEAAASPTPAPRPPRRRGRLRNRPAREEEASSS